MNDEKTIRERLRQACETRGEKARIAEAFDVSQSTVTRWVEKDKDGKDQVISPPMLRLLDWYLFGVAPPSLVAPKNLASILDFSADEWRIVRVLALRAGQTEAKWIAGVARHHIVVERASELVGPPGKASGTNGP